MSEKYISPAEREYIAKAWRNYASVAEIATHLGKSRKTIYAELRRGQDGEKLDQNQRPVYDPELAQRRFQANLRRRGKTADIRSSRFKGIRERCGYTYARFS